MAIDNTPPRMKLIATIAAITIVTLISLDFVFKSYYAYMTDTAGREKVAPAKDLAEQHKAEQAALSQAHVPVDQAIKELAGGTRPEVITPKPSEDLGPMTGWSKLPKAAPTPQPGGDHHGAPPDHAMADAGAHPTAGDAGAPPKADAGAPKKPPAAPKDAGH
jgi:hypothetical protein